MKKIIYCIDWALIIVFGLCILISIWKGTWYESAGWVCAILAQLQVVSLKRHIES